MGGGVRASLARRACEAARLLSEARAGGELVRLGDEAAEGELLSGVVGEGVGQVRACEVEERSAMGGASGAFAEPGSRGESDREVRASRVG